MKHQTYTGHVQAGADIVRRDPAPRTVTREVVRSLKEGGASRDLVDYAERHVRNDSDGTVKK